MDQDSVRPDRKFEGSHLNLQSSDKKSMSTKKNAGVPQDKIAAQKEYIDTLQKQIANMETQISLLKSREVDQKNKASGYETLLRDGIPLNEHFLALKNKFNNEKDQLCKQTENLRDDIQRDTHACEQKQVKIEIYKQELQAMA